MTPQMLEKLATEVATVTGISKEDAYRALEAQEPSTLKLAQDLVELDHSREKWRSNMARHRRRLTSTAV